MPSSQLSVLILYGSQTGNAEAIAKELHSDLLPLLPSSSLRLYSMSDFVKDDDSLSSLPSFPLILTVISTTGQGDPPDNAAKFLRVLRKRLPPSGAAGWLAAVAYTVLAIGDTNYTHFCKPGVRLDGEMAKMGAARWLPLACADDGTRLEDVVEPWKSRVLAKVRESAGATPTASAAPAASATTTAAAVAPTANGALPAATSAAAATASARRASLSSPSSSSAPAVSGLFTPSSTASAIQQAQQAMRALQLARANASQKDNISSVHSSTLATASFSSSSSSSSPSSLSLSLLRLPASLLLFATQTGNSEAIARELHALYSSRFTPSLTLLSMAQFLSVHSTSVLPLASFPLLFVVISSTGQGDPPDNAVRFLRLLKQQGDKDRAWLRGVRVAVLGLGDSNYDTFGAASERVERELLKGGATKLMPREVADDAVGLSSVIEPWKTKWTRKLEEVAHQQPVASSPDGDRPRLPATASGAATDVEEERKDVAAISAVAPAPVIIADETKAGQERPTESADDDPALRTPKVKVAKPIGLARFHPIRISVQLSAPPPSSSTPSSASPLTSSYFSRRWQLVDTEAVLKGYTPDAPFFARLSSARYLTTAKAHEQGRRVVHMELEMSGVSSEAVLYTPGDSIGCFCVNDLDVVQRLVQRLGLRMDDCVDIRCANPADTDSVEQEKKAPPIVHTAAPSPVARALTATPLPVAPLSAHAPSTAGGLSHILTPCSVSDIFLYCVDVATPPKKTFLRMLAEFCHEESDKAQLYHLASHGGKKSYDALIGERGYALLDLLTRFPSCRPPLAYLLDHLPALQPRYYSVTSSPSVHPTSIHVAYTLVPDGVCTTWLTQLCQHSGFLQDGFAIRQGQPLLAVQSHLSSPSSSAAPLSFSIPIFMRRTHTFTLPPSLSTPLIFVGPGTGVAPFRSFLFHRRCQRSALASGGVAMGMWRGLDLDMVSERTEEEEDEPAPTPGYIDRFRRPPRASTHPAPKRSSSSPSSPSHAASSITAVGDVLLFFGCRGADQDFLYREDFDSFVDDRTLTTLVTAFSRESAKKVYVQDRMREHGRRLWELMERPEGGAVLFVCGDGGAMARAVMKALQDAYVQHGGLGEREALERVAQLMRDKRYVQDVWS